MSGDNPSSFTTVADENLYNPLSPVRREVDFPVPTSSSPSSNLRKYSSRVATSPRAQQKPITIFDQIVDWFNGEIAVRRRLAAGVSGVVSAVTFIVTVSVLKLSIWAPFSSVGDSLSWFLYPNNWPPIFCIFLVSFTVALTLIFLFCKVTQLQRLPYTNTNAWAGVGLEFISRLIFVYVAFQVAGFSFATEFAWVVICFAIAVASSLVIFQTDFHLNFSNAHVNSLKSLIGFGKSLPYASLFETCGIGAAIPFTAAMTLILVIGPIFWGFYSWWLFLNLPFHVVLFGACFTQQLYYKLFMKIVNQIIMKPIKFPFPPPYAVHSPTPEQTRTLPNVIETDDPLLKTFALYDLRNIAWNDENRRIEVFSLSQPGKHPRNWKAVSVPCFRMLDELCSRITVAAARLVGYSWDDNVIDNEEVPRDALLMPKKMREIAYCGQSLQQKCMTLIRAHNTQTDGLLAKICQLIGFRTSEKLVISRYDGQMNAYSAEALYMLIVDSMAEDRFGVVQKDLKELMSLLCKLINAIDTYERAKASVADKSDVTYLRMVDSSLRSSLQRVVATFGSHLRSLNLAEEHLRTIRIVCLTDEL